jgi:hypothetical protein
VCRKTQPVHSNSVFVLWNWEPWWMSMENVVFICNIIKVFALQHTVSYILSWGCVSVRMKPARVWVRVHGENSVEPSGTGSINGIGLKFWFAISEPSLGDAVRQVFQFCLLYSIVSFCIIFAFGTGFIIKVHYFALFILHWPLCRPRH